MNRVKLAQILTRTPYGYGVRVYSYTRGLRYPAAGAIGQALWPYAGRRRIRRPVGLAPPSGRLLSVYPVIAVSGGWCKRHRLPHVGSRRIRRLVGPTPPTGRLRFQSDGLTMAGSDTGRGIATGTGCQWWSLGRQSWKQISTGCPRDAASSRQWASAGAWPTSLVVFQSMS